MTTVQDDEEETSNSAAVSRYPCMPSLVAMQQMRNRLNLAYLGKKLMKWSAMATGRELRRISHEMHGVYDDYSDDSRTAYIVLARARYFYPHLNSIVLENVPNKAQLTLAKTIKSISGVKVTQFYIDDTEVDGYPLLGLERGGQLINETKKAWNDLVKRMIMILELRTSFILVEQANRSATKKMNVLGKIVIPKTILSLQYIAAELEEHEREEFFRLKKVLQVKVKKARALYEYLNPEKALEELPDPVPLAIEIPEPVTINIKIPEPLPVTLPSVIEEKRCVVCNELIFEAGEVPLTAELEDFVREPVFIKHVVLQDVNVEDLCPKCKALYDEQMKVEPKLEPKPEPPPAPESEATINSIKKPTPELVAPIVSKTSGLGTYIERTASYDEKMKVELKLEPKPEPLPAPESKATINSIMKLAPALVEPPPAPESESTIKSIMKPTPELVAPVVSKTSGLGTYIEGTASYDEQMKVEPKPEPPLITESKPTTESIMGQTSEIADPVVVNTSNLGTYEEETKEITRILRKKNPDGTITVEKRVVKVRKVVTDPSNHLTDADYTGDRNNDSTRETSGTSSKSNPYSGSKTVGLILVNEYNRMKSRQLVRSRSEELSSTSPMGYPVVRYCISLSNLNCASYEETTSRVEVSQVANRFIYSVKSFDINRKLTSAVSESVLNIAFRKEIIRGSHSCSYEGEKLNSEFD